MPRVRAVARRRVLGIVGRGQGGAREMIPARHIDDPEKVARLKNYISRYRSDRLWAIQKHFKIRTKDKQLVLLRLNEAQIRLHEMAERQRSAHRPVRIIALKPRKVGVSTYIQARFFHITTTQRFTKAMTAAHDYDATEEIFTMSDLFKAELPEILQPMLRYSNRGEMVFENPDDATRAARPGLRSQLKIGTAGKEDLGRSKDIHLLHCSEVAFWEHPEETQLSLLNAMPQDAVSMLNTEVFFESTANGVGDKFHRDYRAAKEGTSPYEAYFMAWHDFHEYSLPLGQRNPLDFEDTLDSVETELRKAYGVTLEQINWRRWAIDTLCDRDPQKFDQEYPADDESCFLASGRMRFDPKMLRRRLLICSDPPARGNLRQEGSRVRIEENERGPLRMWKPPRLGGRYIIGADVAEGLEHGDYSGGHVYDWDTFEQVAEWHGHEEPWAFGGELAMLGNVYNSALIACEANKDGATVNQRLRNDGYPHLYWRIEEDTRGASGRRRARLGWLTTQKSKPMMINALADSLNDPTCVIPSRETIGECLTFVYRDGGMGAQNGCNDDRVIMSAIVSEVRKRQSLESIYPNARAKEG